MEINNTLRTILYFILYSVILIGSTILITLQYREEVKIVSERIDTLKVKVPVYVTLTGNPIVFTGTDTQYVYVNGDTTIIYLEPSFIAQADSLVKDSTYEGSIHVEYEYPKNKFTISSLFTLKVPQKTIYVENPPRLIAPWIFISYEKSLDAKLDDDVEAVVGIDIKDKLKVIISGNTQNKVGIGLGYNF